MPQAALPDLNTAYIIYRREVLNTIKSRNYTAMFGSLFAINALLPENYQVEISDKKYYDMIAQKVFVVCKHCNEETRRDTIKVHDIMTNLIVSTITGNISEKLWDCPKCHKPNNLSKSKMIQEIPKEPTFTKVVPNPPNRTNALNDRNELHKKLEKWAYRLLDELEHQMSLFRLEYKPKDEDMTDNEFMNDPEEGENIEFQA